MTWAILRAQFWELWRVTCIELLIRFVAPLSLLCMYPFFTPQELPGFTALIFLFNLCASLFSPVLHKLDGNGRFGAYPFPSAFSRPIPAFWLAITPLAWLISTNVILYLGLTGVAGKILGVPFPVIPVLPIILLGTVVLTLDAWSVGQHMARCMGTLALIFASWVWLVPRLPLRIPPVFQPAPFREEFGQSIAGYVFALVGGIVFTARCVNSIRELRSGEAEDAWKWQSIIAKLIPLEFDRTTRFRSPFHAQIWFEFRRAWERTVATTCAGLILLVLATSALVLTSNRSSVPVLLWLLVIVIPFLLSPLTLHALLGIKRSGSISWLSIYDATRPIYVSASIALKTATSLSLALAMSLVFAVTAFLCGLFAVPDSVFELAHSILARMSAQPVHSVLLAVRGLATLIFIHLTWILAVSSLWYSATKGRRALFPILGVQVCVSLVLILPFLQESTGFQLMPLVRLCMFGCGGYLIATTALSLYRAIRLGFLRGYQVIVIVAVWVLLLADSRSTLVGLSAFGMSPLVLVVGFLCLPVASFAWAPLSLATARNQ